MQCIGVGIPGPSEPEECCAGELRGLLTQLAHLTTLMLEARVSVRLCSCVTCANEMCGDTSSESGPCCLQVASHLISGLSAAVEGCVRASSVYYGSQSIGQPSRVAVAKAAYNVSPASSAPPDTENYCPAAGMVLLYRACHLSCVIFKQNRPCQLALVSPRSADASRGSEPGRC